jgi:cytochrome c biogenesis factor
MGVLGFVSFGFLLFTIAIKSFERLLPAAADGRPESGAPDPALAMSPMLYMGYVGFSVAAFACAAMLEGKLTRCGRGGRP